MQVFKSCDLCLSRQQPERLLILGYKKKTIDCFLAHPVEQTPYSTAQKCSMLLATGTIETSMLDQAPPEADQGV